MLERLYRLETFGIKLGLENITRLCEALGHPERSFATLHVAGTNGKGSVTAMAHAALLAGGLRAARYTSPHLADITERFVIGGAPVDNAMFELVAHEVLDTAERLRFGGGLSVSPTFFEATTAIGFELFRRAGVEVAVVEVGLGGRFDATNVITPLAGAITTIAFDHQEHLGSTLGAIAFEKAGIIKPGMSVVAGSLPPEAIEIVRRTVIERDARLIEAGRDSQVELEMQDGRANVIIQTPRGTYGPIGLALRGQHQVGNALVAVRLLEEAADRGLRLERKAIEQGLGSVVWPARLELLTLDDGRSVLLDAAHNEQGAEALAAYIQRWHPQRPPLVVGIMRDKDVDRILTTLLPVVSRVTATAAPTRRALPAEELAGSISMIAARVSPDIRVACEPDPMKAVETQLNEAELVCVAGSIVLVGAVRERLSHRAILQ